MQDEPASAGSHQETEAMDLSSSPTKENESPVDADPDTKSTANNTPPARGSPLSWQRRPNSRGGARPLSMLAAQNATQRSMNGSQEQQPPSATEQTFSKEQISQALGSKDPSWFRQTADRGATSAAYRKNQVEDDDRLDMASVKAQLPGMSAETPQKPPSRGEPSTPTQPSLASPLPLNPPEPDDTVEEKPAGDRSSVVLSPGRTSPVRSNSPTKGMGGFVQSAMMKRSDSVKRWSVTSPPSLARVDSVVSNRSSRPQSMVRPGATTPGSSRPTSRQGEQASDSDSTPKTQTVETALEAKSPKGDNDDANIPTTPSKTMDPRRWSPTKSSWLESALNKPESPKLGHKSQNSSQPPWMAELNKSKPETGRPRPNSISHKHQVSIGGLMRSTPMGSDAKPNTTGLGGIYSPPPGGNRPPMGHSAKLSISKSAPRFEPKEPEDKATEQEPEPSPSAEARSQPEPAQEPQQSQEPERRGSVAGHAAAIAAPIKPETPPKKDFRANLRHRPTGSEAGRTEEPEFKSVFGNLRRAKTQNFVAPDELKDNILRGKAALNLTGGPQKNERKDEFKEAILKKKDDFKKVQSEGRGITRSNTLTSDQPLPEGLARRAEISARRGTVSGAKSPMFSTTEEAPKPVPGPKRIPSGNLSSVTETQSTDTEKLTRVSTESNSKPTAEPRPLPGLQKETSAPSRLQGRAGVGKLADRFNPGLAGMLARGPPPMATNGGEAQESSSAKPSAGGSEEPKVPGPQLTHMTKGRVRGPKRKAPTTVAGLTSENAATITKEQPQATPVEQVSEDKSSPVEKEKPSAPTPLSIQVQAAAKAAGRGRALVTKPEPTTPENVQPREPLNSVFARRKSISPEKQSNDIPSPIKAQKTGDAPSQPGSPKKLDMKRVSRFMDDASSANARPESPTKEPIKLTHQRTGSRSPVKTMFERPFPEPEPSSPKKVDSEAVGSIKGAAAIFESNAVMSPPPPPPISKRAVDKPLPEITSRPPPTDSSRPLPTPPANEPKSPPAATSPRQGNDVSTLFSDFFGAQRPKRQYKVDAAEILMNRPQPAAKIQTTGFQMFQVSGDGKKIPVPAHNERVLFEQEMYLCPHNFVNEAGWKKSAVYFWVGDEVPSSTADDAQLFMQREAKAWGGKLLRLQQGKETAEFLQALGGVAIIRRGSSNKYDSLAPNMLCGRRFLGQVAFDEVDFAATSLCAGFPYLIALQGKCYLWKGKGSDIDELSCARLIGMDLTLTGELIEYDDGSEPESFWQLFEGGLKPHSADHWRLKPNYSKYCSRLFCSDAGTKLQVCLCCTLLRTDGGKSAVPTNMHVGLRSYSFRPA